MDVVAACVTLTLRNASYSWPLPEGKGSLTAAELKEEFRNKAKLLYHQRLKFTLKGTVLEDSAELPCVPAHVEVGGPDSIVSMLEMHLRKACAQQLLPVTLWERLGRCGRLPAGPPLPDAALLLWLGDYAGAAERCTASASQLDAEDLREALRSFNASLPAATERSKAFEPVRVAREPAERALRQLDDGGLFTVCGTYKATDNTKISFVFLSLPPGTPGAHSSPAVLLHWCGNAETAMKHAISPHLRELVKAGLLRVVLADYRGYGWGSGTPSLVTLRGDASALFMALPKFMFEWGFDWPAKEKFIVMGRSLGSLCALHIAAVHAERTQGLILDSPIPCHWPVQRVPAKDWRSLGKQLPPLRVAGRALNFCPCCRTETGAKEAQPGREAVWLDAVDLLRSVEVPLLVLNGTEDDVCPPPMVRDLFEASAAPKKKLVRVEGRGHSTVLKSRTYWAEIKAFLAQLTGKEQGGHTPK